VSTGRAIEAVTATLRNLLTPVTANVTARPPDRARVNSGTRQLNLFLYEVVVNGSLRNVEYPTAARGGAGLHPPLALDLRYLLTAYADSDDEIVSQQLLGEAMLAFHDNGCVAAKRFEEALVEAGVHRQPERVRLTPLPLGIDELGKLWTAFQSSFRLSVAYQASVVLVDSKTPARSPLPVLRRGPKIPDEQGRDGGVRVSVAGAPVLDRLWVEAWRGNPSLPARSGDNIILEGARLGGPAHAVFRHPRLSDPLPAIPLESGSTPDRAVVSVPATLPAGFATVEVQIDQVDAGPLTSNRLALPVATRLGSVTATRQADGDILLAVACDRLLVKDQSVVLLVDDQTIPLAARVAPGAGAKPTFLVPSVPGLPADPDAATLRVRVDGVDSVALANPVGGQPLPVMFDPAQSVSVP
jgi:hypothetical protein